MTVTERRHSAQNKFKLTPQHAKTVRRTPYNLRRAPQVSGGERHSSLGSASASCVCMSPVVPKEMSSHEHVLLSSEVGMVTFFSVSF